MRLYIPKEMTLPHEGICFRKVLIPINIDKCSGYMAIVNCQGTTIMRKAGIKNAASEPDN